MKHICSSCQKSIATGETVVQMLEGPDYSAITPAFASLHAEWHRICFSEFELTRQERPYCCVECNTKIEHGERITFFVIGAETDEYSKVAESRGYSIFTPKHCHVCSGTCPALVSS